MKRLQELAIKRIEALAKESKQVVLQNHTNMGEYCRRDSAFSALGDKLDEIAEWASALKNDA